MLSPNDRRIVAQDPALADLATLLDPAAFRDALAAARRELAIDEVTGVYLRYKPGTACYAGYRVVIDGVAVDLYAVTSASADKLRIRSRDRLTGGPFGTLGFRPGERPIMVRVFPNDPELKEMSRIVTGPKRRALPDWLRASPIETLRYKPERRWVARIDAAGGRYCVKVHAANRISDAIAGTTACQTRGPLLIAPTVHADAARAVIVQEWIDGEVLAELQDRDEWDPAQAATVGAALAEVHRQGAIGFHVSRPAGVIDRGLEELGGILGLLAPHHAQRLRTHAATLIGALHELADIGARVHGDFYAKQVLLTGDRAAVLDFDQARLGDPAEDLGNFRAHLLRDVLRGRIASARADLVWRHFLNGYGKAGDDWAMRLQLFIAIGCLRLAPDPFRHREPEWSARLDELIELSIAALTPVLDAKAAVECR